MHENGRHRYFLQDGTEVPGVTTIIQGNLGWAAPSLLNWHVNWALTGKDPRKISRDAKAAGAVAHAMIRAALTDQEPPSTKGMRKAIVEPAMHAFEGFVTWRAAHRLTVISCELSLVSEEHRYGGTLDLLANVDGTPTAIDWKTTNGTHLPHDSDVIQPAAYRHLIQGALGMSPRCVVVMLGKNGIVPPVHCHLKEAQLDAGSEVFASLLRIHALRARVAS